MSGCGRPVGCKRGDEPADQRSAASAAGVDGRSDEAIQGKHAGGHRLSDQAFNGDRSGASAARARVRNARTIISWFRPKRWPCRCLRPLGKTRPCVPVLKVTWSRVSPQSLSVRRIAITNARSPGQSSGSLSSGPRSKPNLLNSGSPIPPRIWHAIIFFYLAESRWWIERDYLELKKELGLGHYDGRGWRGFHHYASLCRAANGFPIKEWPSTSAEDGGEAPSQDSDSQHDPSSSRLAVLPFRLERHTQIRSPPCVGVLPSNAQDGCQDAHVASGFSLSNSNIVNVRACWPSPALSRGAQC